VIISLKF